MRPFLSSPFPAATEFVDCATLMQAEVEVTDIDGNTVTVCGNDTPF